MRILKRKNMRRACRILKGTRSGGGSSPQWIDAGWIDAGWID